MAESSVQTPQHCPDARGSTWLSHLSRHPSTVLGREVAHGGVICPASHATLNTIKSVKTFPVIGYFSNIFHHSCYKMTFQVAKLVTGMMKIVSKIEFVREKGWTDR